MSEFSTEERELGRPEVPPLGKSSGAVELEIVPWAAGGSGADSEWTWR